MRRVGSGTEGLTANVTRVLKHLGLEWESALETRTKDGETLQVVQNQLETGGTEYAKEHDNGGSARPRPEKAARNLDTAHIHMSTCLPRGNTLTHIQKAIHSCAKMWARGRVVTGSCPARGCEKRRLGSWPPPDVNIEEMRPAHRDMLLVQHDAQLLEWAGHHRTDEVAAVSAAEQTSELVVRSEREKKSVGKVAEELGGYFCYDRLQICTDGSCFDPRRERIARTGTGVFFSKDSPFNACFPIEPRTSQTSARGELEAAAYAMLALGMPFEGTHRLRMG